MGLGVLAAFTMSVKSQEGQSLPRLTAVMRRLLGDGGCPWDREQSLSSLKRYAVEEAHEVCDAIDDLGADADTPSIASVAALTPEDERVKALRDELGDLLLQVVFQSEIGANRGWFGIDDVVAAVSNKLERRHPHVFGEVRVENAQQVTTNWEKLKLAEKKRAVLEGIPRGLPALLVASRMGDKASRVGFDWPDARGPREKIGEELQELDEAIARGEKDRVRDELGDVLFAVVNVARKLNIDPEDALNRTNKRFARRFSHVETRAAEGGKALDAHTLEELDAFWNEAKRLEK